MPNRRQRERARSKKTAANRTAANPTAANQTTNPVSSAATHSSEATDTPEQTRTAFVDIMISDLFHCMVRKLSDFFNVRSTCKVVSHCARFAWDSHAMSFSKGGTLEDYITANACFRLMHGPRDLPFQNIRIDGRQCRISSRRCDAALLTDSRGRDTLVSLRTLVDSCKQPTKIYPRDSYYRIQERVIASQPSANYTQSDLSTEIETIVFALKRNLERPFLIDGKTRCTSLCGTIFRDVPRSQKEYVMKDELAPILRQYVASCTNMSRSRLEYICEYFFSQNCGRRNWGVRVGV